MVPSGWGVADQEMAVSVGGPTRSETILCIDRDMEGDSELALSGTATYLAGTPLRGGVGKARLVGTDSGATRVGGDGSPSSW